MPSCACCRGASACGSCAIAGSACASSANPAASGPRRSRARSTRSSSRSRGRPRAGRWPAAAAAACAASPPGSSTATRGTNRRWRNDCLVCASLTPAVDVNSEADKVVDTATMRSERRRLSMRRRVPPARWRYGSSAARIEQAVPQAHQHRLGGVDHRAAADGDQQIGVGLARRARRSNHVVARAVRAHRDETPGQPMSRTRPRCAAAARRPARDSDAPEVTNTRRAPTRSASASTAWPQARRRTTRSCADSSTVPPRDGSIGSVITVRQSIDYRSSDARARQWISARSRSLSSVAASSGVKCERNAVTAASKFRTS